jgi:hypothetical protein
MIVKLRAPSGRLTGRLLKLQDCLLHHNHRHFQEKDPSMKFALWPFLVFLIATFSPAVSTAQQSPPPASSTSPPTQNTPGGTPDAQKETTPKPAPANQEGQSTSGNGKVAGTSNDRLFYTLPNFLTLQTTGKLPPLTVKEKFKVVALGTFDRVNYPWWGLLAAISQGENSEPQFGQGWVAYAKRYGTTAGDSITENFNVGAIFPSILHQDPRFYQLGKGSIPRRTWYAATRILVTRGDSGKAQFNFSEVFGAAFAAAVSTYTYHPRSAYISTTTNPHLFVASDRTLSNTFDVWGTQVGLDTITYVVKEFWPDVHRKLSHKHNSGTTQSPGSNQ